MTNRGYIASLLHTKLQISHGDGQPAEFFKHSHSKHPNVTTKKGHQTTANKLPRDWGSNRQLGWQEMTNCKRWRRHAFRPCVASNHPHDETFFRTKELLLSRFQSLAREHSMPLLTQARAHLPLNCQRKRPLSGRSFPKQSVDQPTCVEYISMHYIVRNIRDKLKNNKTIHTYI